MIFATPTISILIPVFNREAYITECVNSAINQTVRDIEIIIVDNCSTDGTWRLCQEIASADSRVKIYQNSENIGPVQNWLRCAQLARSRYSKILFSDDVLDPRFLDLTVSILSNEDVGLVACGACIGTSELDGKPTFILSDNSRMSSSDYIDLLLYRKASPSPGAIILRTADLQRYILTTLNTKTPREFSRHGAGPDVMISLLVAANYKYVGTLAEPLVFFRSHKQSITVSDTNGEVYRSYITTMSHFLQCQGDKASWSKFLAYYWLRELRASRKWVSIKLFLLEFEGSGKKTEILQVLVCSFGLLARRFLYRRQLF